MGKITSIKGFDLLLKLCILHVKLYKIILLFINCPDLLTLKTRRVMDASDLTGHTAVPLEASWPSC